MTQISNMDLSESGIDLYSNNKSFEEIYREMTKEGTPANDAYNSMSPDNRKLIKELHNITVEASAGASVSVLVVDAEAGVGTDMLGAEIETEAG